MIKIVSVLIKIFLGIVPDGIYGDINLVWVNKVKRFLSKYGRFFPWKPFAILPQ